MNPVSVLLTIAMAYVIGSFPTAYFVGRFNNVNIFDYGSGNMGATNAIRVLGVKWGALVWVIDLSKGVLSVCLAMQVLHPYVGWAKVIGALAAIIGHNWSIFATLLTGRIRGGKGAATWLGTFIMMAPAPVFVVVAVIFMVIVLVTRYVSLGVLISVFVGGMSMAGLAIGHVYLEISSGETTYVYMLYGLVGIALIAYRHRENIQRLISGTERRLGDRA